jgi:hypothetical protein
MNVTVTILSNGEAMDPSYQLLSVNVQREVNRIPTAELTLLDGNLAQRKFEISDKPFFEPGKDIEIKLRIEGNSEESSVFKGPVVRHSLEAHRDSSRLVVGMKDAAVKLTGARHSAVYNGQDDSEIIKKILKDADVNAGTVADATKNTVKLSSTTAPTGILLFPAPMLMGFVLQSIAELSPSKTCLFLHHQQ